MMFWQIISDSVYVMLLLEVVLIYLTNVTKMKKIRGVRYASWAIFILLLSFAISTVLKILFPEVRPLGIGNDSFPSRHAQVAFTGAALTSGIHIGKRTKYLEALFYVWAVVISVSRVLANAHYIHDVVVGALIGWLIGFIALKLIRLKK